MKVERVTIHTHIQVQLYTSTIHDLPTQNKQSNIYLMYKLLKNKMKGNLRLALSFLLKVKKEIQKWIGINQ